MRFREILFLLAALTTVTGLAAGADEPSSSKSQEAFVIPMLRRHPALNSRQFFSPPNQSGTPAGSGVHPSVSWDIARVPGTIESQAPMNRARARLEMQTLNNRDLCYTMRTYVVSPSEHLAGNESGFRRYSSCQQASMYQFRSTDAQGQNGVKLK